MQFIVLSFFYHFFPFVVFCFPLSLAVPQLSSPLISLILIHFLPRAFPQIPFSFSLPLISPCLLPVSISPVPFIPFPIFSSFLLSYSHNFFPNQLRFSISPFPTSFSFLNLSYSLNFSLFLFLSSLLFPLSFLFTFPLHLSYSIYSVFPLSLPFISPIPFIPFPTSPFPFPYMRRTWLAERQITSQEGARLAAD